MTRRRYSLWLFVGAALALSGCGELKGRRLHQVPYQDNIPVAFQQKVLTGAVNAALAKADFSAVKAKSGFVDIVALFPTSPVLPFIKSAVEAKLASQGVNVLVAKTPEADYRFLTLVDVSGADLVDEYKEFMWSMKFARKGFYQGKVRLNIVAYPTKGGADALTFEGKGEGEKVDLEQVRR